MKLKPKKQWRKLTKAKVLLKQSNKIDKTLDRLIKI